MDESRQTPPSGKDPRSSHAEVIRRKLNEKALGVDISVVDGPEGKGYVVTAKRPSGEVVPILEDLTGIQSERDVEDIIKILREKGFLPLPPQHPSQRP